MARGKVDDRSWNKERRNTAGTLFQQNLMFALNDFESADSAADVDASTLRFLRVNLEAGAFQGEIRCRNGKPDESPHLLDVFFLDVIARIETLHFACDLAGKGRRVKCCNAANAGLPFFQC